MSISESQSTRCESVNVWSIDQATVTTVTVHVTNPEIVSQNENDVRSGCGNEWRKAA
jgi:hypothetical protein